MIDEPHGERQLEMTPVVPQISKRTIVRDVLEATISGSSLHHQHDCGWHETRSAKSAKHFAKKDFRKVRFAYGAARFFL